MKDKMIKACIFDLDGTIADTLESMAYVANEIMEKFSISLFLLSAKLHRYIPDVYSPAA